jgi:hypothetical protein
MKQLAPKPRPGKRYGLALLNFTDEQLVGIGKVAVTYNVAEELIDDLTRIGWRLDFDAKEVLTRIGGIDGKIHLIKHAATVWGMPPEMSEALSFSLGKNGFETLKKYRDGVIHARPWDAKNAVGVFVERQNRRVEVLLSAEALNGLATRLDVLWLELRALKEAYLPLRNKAVESKASARRREQLEAEYQAAMAQYQSYRSQRLSLPPLPEFPEPLTQDELLEALRLDQRDRQ